MTDILPSLQTAVSEQKLSQAAFDNIKSWLENEQVAAFHPEIEELTHREDWKALEDAFYTQIEFGTAGIRGKTGLGSARINSWTIGTAAQGLADYISTFGDEAKKKGVVVGSDTRLTSPEFVQLVADVLTSNGIDVYKFERAPQVGMFSYAVRLHKAQAGVYISASHNPPTDNGFKCYWDDGAQVLPPHDKKVTEAVKQVKSIKKDTPNNDLIKTIGDDFDSAYRARVLSESVYHGRSATTVYSPFHGTGQYGVLPILQEAGFNVLTVDEQMTPDGNFPNVPGGVPNPENTESNQLTADMVKQTKADLGISTDPDADRLGLVVPKQDGTVILTGNETVTLLAYFICKQLQSDDKLPSNGFLVRTLVTTPIIDAIAESFKLKVFQTFVGFKYIGEIITQHEDLGDELYVYGGEESYGSLKGSYAHDKDASSAALIAAEMVSWLKDNNRTVWDLFEEIYRQYGYYHNDLLNLKFEGAEGFAKMTKLMDSIRQNPPKKIGDWDVKKIADYKTSETRDTDGNVLEKDIAKHTTNMIMLHLSDDGKNVLTIRPSGTEPKIKIYIALANKKATETNANLEDVISETKAQSDELKKAVNTIAENLTK